jgi:N-acetylneuraminate synthase
MIIDRNIAKYAVFSEDPILNALRRISDNKSGAVFSVTEDGKLEGVLTDGDFRRWLLEQREIDLNLPVSAISNKDFEALNQNARADDIESKFSDRIHFIPLLDDHGHLVAVARDRPAEIRIGGRAIGGESPCFVIAEIGNNHNGKLDLAKRLIDLAADAGADCAKFQIRNLRALYRNAGDAQDASEDLGSQYTLDLLARFQLQPRELFEAFDHCRARGVIPLCTPWDAESVAELERYGIEAYKSGSADLTNHDLLQELAKTGKPLIVSTGMSSEREILDAVRLLRAHSTQYVLLHCNSTYPAPFKDVQLNYMDRLRQIGNCPVGYSGHERGFAVPVAAVARGAKVIEKHFTLDRNMEGNDHRVSLLPDEFKAMVQSIREIEQALGTSAPRKATQGELLNREVLGKSVVARRPIEAGETVTDDMLDVKSPGRGLPPYRKKELIGKVLRRDVAAGDFFYASDLQATEARPRAFKFRRPFGVPVRFHDFEKIALATNADFIEFHLSYRDLEVDFQPYIGGQQSIQFMVHSPELFANDHIMDLCSPDRAYRERSIRELQRVVDLTRTIKKLFPKTKRPLIIINAGGFTMDHHLPKGRSAELYKVTADSLTRIDDDGVELIPQTMPPFPWHFGGQRYHNLFVDPDEIKAFCEARKYRVCLDLSHSKLACNHFKWSWPKFIKTVGPYSAHLHVADAAGVDGEGLQIGDGEIDFAELGELLAQYAQTASFIPEVWQGHKNSGEGFWRALGSLEGRL